jgi:hypothetical protein
MREMLQGLASAVHPPRRVYKAMRCSDPELQLRCHFHSDRTTSGRSSHLLQSVLMKFQVLSQWGVPCRTPRCRGFAVLSQMVLKGGLKHPQPSERGVGTCEICGCQYSIRPEQVERRVIEGTE